MLLRPSDLILKQDRSDRKEVFFLIERLDAKHRIEWIGWCCRSVSGGVVGTRYVGQGGSVEIFSDWQHLCHQHGLSINESVAELVRLVRQHGRPIVFGVE